MISITLTYNYSVKIFNLNEKSISEPFYVYRFILDTTCLSTSKHFLEFREKYERIVVNILNFSFQFYINIFLDTLNLFVCCKRAVPMDTRIFQ